MRTSREQGARWPGPLRTAATVVAAVSVGMVGEVVWVVRRRLPSLDGMDASGLIGQPRHPPLRLVVLGDSTLTGPGLASPDEIWLRRALHELALEQPVEVVSLAVGGSRVADVRRRVDDALAVDADVAVVAVGANDAIRATPAGQFGHDLEVVVSRLLDRIPVVAVGNLGDLGNLARVPPPLTAMLRRRSRTICRQIEAVVARHDRAVLLDITPTNAGFRDRGVFAADLFHPSEVGHSLWAAAAVPGLREALHPLVASTAGGERADVAPRHSVGSSA